MEPHPAYMFTFTPQFTSGLVVHSHYTNPLETCRKNPGLQWTGAVGVALLPEIYLKGCQLEADKLNGFFVLHGPERLTDGPVLLYSIYPMYAAPYFGHSRGRFSVMQFPGSIQSFTLPNTPWRYTGAYVPPPDLPSSHSRLDRLADAIQAPSLQYHSAQSKRVDPANASFLRNRNMSSQGRGTHSTPPPLTVHDTPRLLSIEAGLEAIESHKQHENLKALLGVGSRPVRPRCNSSSWVNANVDSPHRRNTDEPSDTLQIIRRESLQEGPINVTKLHAERPINLSGSGSTRGRSRYSREPGSASCEFSPSARGRSLLHWRSVELPRPSQLKDHSERGWKLGYEQGNASPAVDKRRK